MSRGARIVTNTNIASNRWFRCLYDSFAIEIQVRGSNSIPTTNILPQPAPSRLPDQTSEYAGSFNPEIDLILACCRADPDGASSARIHSMLQAPANLDWGRLLELAQHHGLVPLLYRRLTTAGDATQPAWLQPLREQYNLNAHRTLRLSVEMVNIYKHLATRGLQVLPYKGPVLAERLYGNVALRQFSDLDFLVREPDLPSIRLALAEFGYKQALLLSPAAERAYLKSGYEYTFDGTNGRNLIEIKWQILPRFYSIAFEVNDLFERAVAVNVAGQQLRALSDQDLMLVLCVHAAKHGWMQLSWLCDITQLARSRAIDWEALRTEAARLGIARIVAVSFLLAHHLLATEVPPKLNADNDVAAEEIAGRILGQIVAGVEHDPESVSYFRLMMELRERSGDRSSFWWRLLTTPSAGEWAAIRLPGPLFPLYRMVRMGRLTGRLLSSQR